MSLLVETRQADVLIIGGGTAGCYAALTLAKDPNVSVLLVEKANIRRSGCLAAGVNAINAYLSEGNTPEDYVDFVRWDAEGILRDDLVRTMAEGFNHATEELERLGLVIQKDDTGKYVTRGRWNIKINGENIKPILETAVEAKSNVSVLNHVNITDYLKADDRVVGAVGFSVNEHTAYSLRAKAVICATGGAAGLYRPNNPGFSRHKMWYPPFNTGAGYSMGIRAGAEMTSFEMRFVAQRCKDTIAPTGTIALGVGAREINGNGAEYETEYGLTTSGRAYGTAHEAHEGRGPCYLETEGISPAQDTDLLKAYLNMAPSQTLRWVESGRMPSQQNVELECTEPYIVGGHTGSGYWVDTDRRTTVTGLYAAGDVSGGAPKKFVTGALAEGEIAANAVLHDLTTLADLTDAQKEAVSGEEREILQRYTEHLSRDTGLYSVADVEEAMQKAMDNYAGGIRTDYRYNRAQLDLAGQRIEALMELADRLAARDMDELLHLYEVKDRLVVCRSVIAHLRDREETRWPGFGINTDHPEQSADWNLFVNSKLENGEIRIIHRPLQKGGTRFEHTH